MQGPRSTRELVAVFEPDETMLATLASGVGSDKAVAVAARWICRLGASLPRLSLNSEKPELFAQRTRAATAASAAMAD